MRQALHDTGTMLDPMMACYHACHNYKGGLTVVAHLMGVNYNTFAKKLNPTQETHVLTAAEMVQIMNITGDRRIIDALCAAADGVFIANDEVPSHAGDVDLLESFSELINNAAAVQVHVSNALADGEVDAVEFSQLQRIQHSLDTAQAAVNKVVEQFRGAK